MRKGLVAALGALVVGLAAAPAGAQERPPQLQPSPQQADQYRDFCRQRPADCTGNFDRDRDRLLLQDMQRAQEDIRRAEQLRQLELQQQQQQR